MSNLKTPPKFGARETLSGERLQEFRNYVAQLKRQKLITRKGPASSARPYFIQKGPRGGSKTLRDIVNENLDKVTPATKLLPLGEPVSIRSLPTKAKGLASLLKDIEKNYKEIDALKKPKEVFAFQINGMRSYATFGDIRLLVEYLGESAGIQQVLHKHRQSSSIFKALKIARWNKSAKAWKPSMQHLSPQALRTTRRRNRKKK
jgi:hypothetical protein